MKVKTSDLTGTALDWAVAKCEMVPLRIVIKGQCPERMDSDRHDPVFYSPSTNWAQGGSIIKWEKLCIDIDSAGVWLSWSKQNYNDEPRHMVSGPTPLIAAMRCYVTSKLGDEIEVPDEIA